ncbi:MAG: prepilin-type N-terminal cleavage/methylation domain-containing protein [Planctomycetota bacterium]
MREHSRGDQNRPGFTLIELLIVLVILAALAALVVPMVGWARVQANYATAASGASEAFNNLELYRSSTGVYPARFDSLMNDSEQSLYLSNGNGDSVWGPDIQLDDVCELASQQAGNGGFSLGVFSYYLRNDGSLTSFVNHGDFSSTYSGPNTSTDGSPTYTPGGVVVDEIIDPGPDGILGTADDVVTQPEVLQDLAVVKRLPDPSPFSGSRESRVGTLARIIRTAYPDQADPLVPAIPDGHALIAVGIGGRSGAVGSTMSTPPQFSGTEAGKYGRYIAFFDVQPGATGRGRVQLKMVTDPNFAQIAQNVDRFKAAGPQQ